MAKRKSVKTEPVVTFITAEPDINSVAHAEKELDDCDKRLEIAQKLFDDAQEHLDAMTSERDICAVILRNRCRARVG